LMNNTQPFRVQGRWLWPAELQQLQRLIDRHPQWTRHRVACHLCQQWDWQTSTGQPKTFAARSLLLTLAQRHGLRLPPVQAKYRPAHPWGIGSERSRSWAGAAAGPAAAPVEAPLPALQPLQWHLAPYGCALRERALSLLRQHHYLGCNRPVGSHLIYLVSDKCGRELAVHLIGAAAWQCAARDRFIGWRGEARRAHLPRVANHSRFLILPWVRVPHLASHLLGQLVRRVRQDWPQWHGQSLELLESFVEVGRFTGTAYRAANWQGVGQTTGRSRQEKAHRLIVAPKAVWIYPLHPQFRERLSQL
jgi:hypothetical protein